MNKPTEHENKLFHALCKAIYEQNAGEVKDLLEAGANPGLRPDLVSPLYLAVRDNNKRITDLLLVAGAEFNLAIDSDKLKECGASAHIKYALEMLIRKTPLHTLELWHDHAIDFDLERHVSNMQRLAGYDHIPKKQALLSDAQYEGVVWADMLKEFNISPPIR